MIMEAGRETRAKCRRQALGIHVEVLEQIDVAANRVEGSAQLVTHHCEKLRFGAVGGIGSCPRFLRFADDGAQLFVGESQLLRELHGLVGLMRQLLCLVLEKAIALFEGSQTRSRGLTLPGHSHSANQRVHLFWDGKWHLRARNSGYSRDDFLLGADTSSAKLSRRARYLAPNAYL